MDTINVRYNNNKNIFVTLKNSQGTAINLTDAEIYFTVKPQEVVDEIDNTDENALLIKQVTDITPEEGKFTLTIAPEDTVAVGLGCFSYDFKIKRSAQSQYSSPVGMLTIGKVVRQE